MAVAAAVVSVLAACSGGGPEVPERSADDAPGRTTSTTAAPPPGLERVTASPSALPGEVNSRFTGVAVGSRAIVVVGEQEGEAAVWTTFDGITYEPVPLDEGDFPGGTVLHDLVVTSEGFVIVGSAHGRAAAWSSAEGRSWTANELEGGTVADVVIVGELGITAFGRDGDTIVTWTSFDGLSWQRVPGGTAVFDRPGGARVVGAYDDGDTFLALVDRDGVAETWRSPDGRSWSPEPPEGAELLPAEGPPRPTTLLGAGSTVVVLGAVADPDGVDAAVWTSVAGAPWERVSPSEAVFGGDGAQVIEATTQLGSDLVAVGTDTDDLGDVDAVVWSTGSGGGWRRSAEQPGDGLSGRGDQHAVDLAPTRDGALVVGWEVVDGATRAVAWSLVDGEDEALVPPPGPSLGWQRVPPDEALGGPGEQRLDAVVATADVLVAVGSSVRPGEPTADLDGAVWRSSDGISWERVPDDGAALGGPGDQEMLGIVEDPGSGGALVAVGRDGTSAAVWVRFPGDAGWGRVPADEGTFGGAGEQVARSVAAGPDGSLVAVGVDRGSGDAAVWRSTQGRDWERVLPGDDLGGDGVQEMTAVTTVGPVLVAVGTSGGEAVAWTSLDGLGWARTELGPGRADGVAPVEGGVVAVGSVAGAGGELDATAWRSADGRSWVPVTIDDGTLGDADQQLLGVLATTTADDDQLVAGVGWTNFGPGDDGAAWASLDGESWTRTPHDEDVFGGDQAQRMLALAELEDVVVAVGWSGSSPAERDAAVWVTAPVSGGGGIL